MKIIFQKHEKLNNTPCAEAAVPILKDTKHCIRPWWSNVQLYFGRFPWKLTLHLIIILDFHHSYENHVPKTWKTQQYIMCWGCSSHFKHTKHCIWPWWSNVQLYFGWFLWKLTLHLIIILDFHHLHVNHVPKTWKTQQYTMCWDFITHFKTYQTLY